MEGCCVVYKVGESIHRGLHISHFTSHNSQTQFHHRTRITISNSMSSIQDKLKATAADNDRLLKIISDTDYAPSALRQSNGFVANLKKEILQQEKDLRDSKYVIAKEEKEHKEYQTSHVKRLAYRLGGKKEKFEQKASKEEKDWVEAVQRGFECQKNLDLLNKNLAEAAKTSAEMEKVAATYQKAQSELDTLYKSIFEGPTPEIFGEDQKESAVYEASAKFDAAQGALENEKRSKRMLVDAFQFLEKAARDVEDARSNAKMDAFGFDSPFMDYAEANALSRVRQNVGQAEMLVSSARTIQPAIGDIGNVVHAQHNFMSEVLFDNVFSDVAKYDAIKESQESITAAKTKLDNLIRASNTRIESMIMASHHAKQDVDERRLELQKIRAEAYQKVAGTEVAAPSGPPPDYRA